MQHHPVRWAVFLSVENRTYHVALEAELLAVHFPSAADHDLAELFGSMTGDDVDKFARCEWTEGPDGVPLLTRCPDRFVARVLDVVDVGGDHVCFVVEPITVEHAEPAVPTHLPVHPRLDTGPPRLRASDGRIRSSRRPAT